MPTQLGDNVSMGLAADGSIAYFTTPTPGAANTTHSFTEPLNGGYTDMEGVYISEVLRGERREKRQGGLDRAA